MIHSITNESSFRRYSAYGTRAINSISRAKLNESLLDTAEGTAGVRLCFGHRLQSADADTGRLTFDTDAGTVSADAEVVLVIGGDMPSLVPAVLRRLVDALDDPSVDAVVLEAGGRHRPLPMALRRAPAIAVTAMTPAVITPSMRKAKSRTVPSQLRLLSSCALGTIESSCCRNIV